MEIKKHLRTGIILSIVALFFLIYQCANNKENIVKGEKIQLKRELEKNIKELDGLKIETRRVTDSILVEDRLKQAKIKELNKQNNLLHNSIAENRKNKDKKVKDASKYSFKQTAEFIAIRYNSKPSVTFYETSISLKDSVPNLIAVELIEKDALEKDVNDYIILADNKTKEITLLNETIVNKDTQLSFKTKEYGLLEESFEYSQEISKKSEKEIKQLKNKNFLNKLLIVASGVGGFLLAGAIK